MTDDASALGDRISDLEDQLHQANSRADANAQQLEQLGRSLAVAQQRAADADKLQQRITELERLLAPAEPSSGVLTVSYSDGRVKYAAQDGSKYPIVSDAARRNKLLALMKTGLGETQAELILQRGDEVLKALTS